ncbi:MAG: penicillin-binding protein 2 [Spirochaetae bacterium HGW-Spirochaetae-3]|jgi:penicillin-binding protein 2|nr:MAG: penicillin-binding protein 2 [Spirochaetae bacterium HGW-Spirochaetae-3]
MSDYSEGPKGNSQSRFLVLLVIAVFIFVSYSSYLFYLQVVRGVEYQKKAVTISRQIERLPAQRGEIYDRNYNLPLVLNIDSFALVVVPAEIPAPMRDTVFAKLAAVLDEPIDEIRRRIPPSYYRMFQQVEISSSVDQSIIVKIAERIDEFPGVSWYSRPKRNYLETGSFSHIIGYVGDISRDELKIYYNRGYQTGDIIGKAGIERQYDSVLRGTDGRQYKTVDVRGRRVEAGSRDVDPPLMGKNIVLTIDRSTQILAEKALGERIGSVVVLKPATGEILALVSYPSFNANMIVEKGGNNEYARLLADPRTPLIQRAIQSSYPPASTFKTVMTAGIVEEKAIPLDETVLCNGEISYGDRIFRCHIRKPGHGRLDLESALAQSCDVYFWEVGRDKLGIERIVSYAREFGFGQETGIDLPGEVAGFVPTPQWKERRFHEKWLGGDTLNLAIGQGYMLATPLQLADMMAMVVNEGVIYKPHLLKEIRDPRDGSIMTRTTPEVLMASSISKETFKITKEYLRGVIVNGTARYPVSTKTVSLGGKTGTAEVGLSDRWHSWFVGFGPTDATNPEDVIIVVAMIEATNPWEWWAPYATNIVFQGYFGGQTYEEAAAQLGLLGRSIPVAARAE